LGSNIFMQTKLTTDLAAAGSHYGYSKSRRHPSVKKFIASTSGGTDFLDPEVTASQVTKAAAFVKDSIASGKKVLFIGQKPEIRQIVKEMALSAGEPYMADRFVAGTITNFGEIRRRAEKLVDMLSKKEKGEYAVYTKKEQLEITRTIERMDRNFGGIIGLDKLPAVVIVVDPRHEEIAVLEAVFAHIPVVAIASTDCNITNVDFPILANDANIASVRLILGTIRDSILEAKSVKTPTA
jgi:small subunit ribosomal protein S2